MNDIRPGTGGIMQNNANEFAALYERAQRELRLARRNIGRAWRILEESKIKLADSKSRDSFSN